MNVGTGPTQLEVQMFSNNVGGLDRIIRIVIGAAALVAFFVVGEVAWKWVLLLGVVPLLTGLAGTCPVYSILGLSTCPVKQRG